MHLTEYQFLSGCCCPGTCAPLRKLLDMVLVLAPMNLILMGLHMGLGSTCVGSWLLFSGSYTCSERALLQDLRGHLCVQAVILGQGPP